MQRLEVSCAVRRMYTSLGAKGLKSDLWDTQCIFLPYACRPTPWGPSAEGYKGLITGDKTVEAQC